AKNAAGAALFAQTGCAACHATLHLADGRPVPAYTDLLLHDLGSGLNDGIKEGAAEPGFWRTAPLWDVASSLKIGGLLHDGRARQAESQSRRSGRPGGARAHRWLRHPGLPQPRADERSAGEGLDDLRG